MEENVTPPTKVPIQVYMFPLIYSDRDLQSGVLASCQSLDDAYEDPILSSRLGAYSLVSDMSMVCS